MKKTFFLLIIILLVPLYFPEAKGCRYTIREIGYTPLRLQTYILEMEVDTLAHRSLIERFRKIATEMESTTNIRYRVRHAPGSPPELYLLNTKGNTLLKAPALTEGEIRSFYREVLFSPLQRTFCEQIGNVFAFLVCFYDEQDTASDRALEEALARFARLAPTLDKPADLQIMKIVVPSVDREKEGVVLRAAGIDPYDPAPVVMVVYGRGRLAGPPLQDGEITRDNLLRQLVMLGTDCECGIDLSPLLQRALPLQWTAAMSQKVADMLGFDVENPMVLNEMSQILAKEPTPTVDEVLTFAPRSVDLDKVFGKKNPPSPPKASSATLRTTLAAIAITLLVVLAGIIFLIVRKRK